MNYIPNNNVFSHLREPVIRALRANDVPSPFKQFEKDFERAQIQNRNWCDCKVCPTCVGRYNAVMDNIADELIIELEEE